METAEELREFLESATREQAWGRLLYRGTAWSLMRTNGALPDDAPAIGETIDTDLEEHGFAVLRAALNLRDIEGTTNLTSRGFERSARAFEALVKNGSPETPERGFHRIISASSYHLAGFSAVAYSLLANHTENLNDTPAEHALMLLMLRDMEGLRRHVKMWSSTNHESCDPCSHDTICDNDIDDIISRTLNISICRALAYFEFALQTGEQSLWHTSTQVLDTSIRLAANAANVTLWWMARITRALTCDLWDHSLHKRLPSTPPDGADHAEYEKLRAKFIASLYSRRASEVELWPSQLEAAARSTDVSDDLVTALPTSAGKTRVAEIAALMALATNRRVLIVTPLRALSAQTERSFSKTFSTLGFTVSSLYGAGGISPNNEDALRSRDIVISTPEKLDFALRNDTNIINDIGVVILDEGHMIGPTEREIRYEILVQRLLRRHDASERRIVCLSAILPSGEELEDLTAWIRSNTPGDPIRSDWRPTRQRFGTLVWKGKSATLNYDLDKTGPYLSNFVTEMAPLGRARKPYPRDVQDLTIQAAWKFAIQGKRTLVYCTQASWVEGYGKCAVALTTKGYLSPLLENEQTIARALKIGREWLGETHPAVESLRVGVALHHGKLPSPFLRELETLLAAGTLKVIVASPTLAQGLNLNAAVLLVPYLVRSGIEITGEEFANVAGRAGRAFVDSEGLIVHVIMDRYSKRLSSWKSLVTSTKARTLKSGLIYIVSEILDRLARTGALNRIDAFEYLANSRSVWMPEDEAAREEAGDADYATGSQQEEPLSHLVEKLDTTVFGLVEALDAGADDLPRLLDEALADSLWSRQIAREGAAAEQQQRALIVARARLIWKHTSPASRKGHFAMGIGLEAGLAIDSMADELDELVDKADVASLSGNVDDLVSALSRLSERLLTMRPFIPDPKYRLPDDKKNLLRKWISGDGVDAIGAENMRVIEEVFAYRLVWALEALRTKRVSQGWEPEIIAGGAAATLETGVPQFMMTMLIRAGLPSRVAAIAAIRKTNPFFTTTAEMKAWLLSDEIQALAREEDWPTADTADLWRQFAATLSRGYDKTWEIQRWKRALKEQEGAAELADGTYRLETDSTTQATWLLAPDYRRVAQFVSLLQDTQPGLWFCNVRQGSRLVEAVRIGPGKARWPSSK